MNETQEWTTVIQPKDKLLSVDFKELWRYRDLYTLFVKRNIITQYKQTVLGPLWFVIQPVLTVIMYMVVFGGIAGIATDDIPQPLFYLAGTCMWQYFSTIDNAIVQRDIQPIEIWHPDESVHCGVCHLCNTWL